MRTIAISIDDASLAAIDRIAASQLGPDARSRSARARRANRSAVIRRALRDFVAKTAKQEREAREAAIFKAHRAKLRRQAQALVEQQARP